MDITKMLIEYVPLFLSGLFSVIVWFMKRHLKNLDRLSDKIESLDKNMALIVQSLNRNDATIKMQQDLLLDHIKSLVKLDSKLDAVFRFIDAPQRNTDINNKSL